MLALAPSCFLSFHIHTGMQFHSQKKRGYYHQVMDRIAKRSLGLAETFPKSDKEHRPQDNATPSYHPAHPITPPMSLENLHRTCGVMEKKRKTSQLFPMEKHTFSFLFKYTGCQLASSWAAGPRRFHTQCPCLEEQAVCDAPARAPPEHLIGACQAVTSNLSQP